ncbi:MAG TPA: hypothetical protein VEB69_14090 [Acidimicrobiia bacterium]|nr:hypothetical protein [Acidimicrobiia bacterium]
MSTQTSPESPGLGATISGFLGVLLYLALGFLYLTSGLVVPLPGLIVLWAVWVAGWFLVVRLFRTRRVWVPVVAVGGVLFWWGYVSLGAALFDWTA